MYLPVTVKQGGFRQSKKKNPLNTLDIEAACGRELVNGKKGLSWNHSELVETIKLGEK